MAKGYVSSAFLKVEDSRLYAIFAWSQRPKQQIIAKSWLLVLEVFVHEHDIEKAYRIFQKISLLPISERVISEINKQASIVNNQDLVVLLSERNITLFGKGFRSFIEKEMQVEFGTLSRETYQVLLYLFSHQELKDDLHSINSREAFIQLVGLLENQGLLSPAIGTLDWGDLKKIVPICHAFGLTRGTPIDRYYLRKFIEEIRQEVVGNVLEVGGTPKDRDFYQLNPATSYRILNLEAGPGIDIVGDVHEPSVIEPESVDSVVIFNVLEHCYAPWVAVENIYSWLKVGGKCFAMVPNAIRVHATPVDYWRPLPDAFSWLFRNFSNQKLYVYGNPITVIASFHGIAVEELTSEELDAFHPDYPVATCIVAQKH